MNTDHVVVNGRSLTIADVLNCALSGAATRLDNSVSDRLSAARSYLQTAILKSFALDRNSTVEDLKRYSIYGVSTGFGSLKNNRIRDRKDALDLQRNVVLSHACGVMEPFDEPITRAIMLIRANTLASGYCGVRLELVQRVVDMLNADVLPVIPSKGSVGASGDLAPLAHFALAVLGEGPITYKGQLYQTLREATELIAPGLFPNSFGVPVALDYKEGLALVNGLAVTTAVGIIAYHRAAELINWADLIAAMTLEAILGSPRAIDEIVFSIYGHPGAHKSATRMRTGVAGSSLLNQSDHVHDPYSVRCAAQVHGAVRDGLDFVERVISRQLVTIDDDPVFFSTEELSRMMPWDGWTERLHFEHGHFHGEPLGFAFDLMGIEIAELASISERRTQMLLDKNHNRGLPACLVADNVGNLSGLMIAQYTAAALVSESKILSHPASTDSIPTSANTEDHVSMATIAARKALNIVEHAEHVLAIELLCASEALGFRLGMQLPAGGRSLFTGQCGVITGQILEEVRGTGGTRVPFLAGRDRVLYEDIKTLVTFLRRVGTDRWLQS